MPNLISEFRKNRIALGDMASTPPVLARATIDTNTGAHSTVGTNGRSLVLVQDDSSTAIAGHFKAEKVWNAVWNDIADFQRLDDRLEYGRCYVDTPSGAKICSSRCQMSVIGIASDTFGFGVGSGNPNNQSKEIPIAVVGWTLAHVDQEYLPGTVLTNDERGGLTKMSFFEKLLYPERIVAIYKRKETQIEFGSQEKKVQVLGRHWVKVK